MRGAYEVGSLGMGEGEDEAMRVGTAGSVRKEWKTTSIVSGIQRNGMSNEAETRRGEESTMKE